VTWFDTATPESLLEAGLQIAAIEKRFGLKIACLEEIALRRNLVSREDFTQRMNGMPPSSYKMYLQKTYDDFISE
jgi:glucose-1-phosphate thymidylyltransferase